jgi:thiamine biosynthesis lipoprotein
MSGGKRVSHLIDPASGYPFYNELISVTIYAEKAIIADGYDNALMGMGLSKGLRFMAAHPEMEAYFIYHKTNGAIADTATRGFYKMF